MDETEEEITPRQYQNKLAEHCVENDAIAVLPTGSGKTLVAILLMKALITKSNFLKKSAFIVNKVVNVEQQYDYIKKQSRLRVEKWHRKLTNNSADFVKVIQENDVIVLTAAACESGITHGWIKMKDFALIVIDECHHSMAKKHPCRFIVERIKEHKKVYEEQLPRFLGLTACGLNGKVISHQLPQKFMQLEITLGAGVITSNEHLQDDHRNVVKETVFFTDIYKEKTTFNGLNELETFCLLNNEFSNDIESDPRKKIVELVRRAKTILDDCGLYCGYIVIKHDIIPYIEKMRDNEINSSDKYVILSCALTVFGNIQIEMEFTLQNCNTYEQITAHLHSRVTKIIEVLEAYEKYQIQNGKRCVAIIFAEKCDTVMALTLLLQKLVKLRPSFIKAAYAVGGGIQRLKFGETESENSNGSLVKTLEKLRNLEINCLVATPVLEEGIDISSCNLVICTHVAPTFCSYIQTRGRARDSCSMLAYIISHEDRSKYIYNTHIFKSNEKFLLQRIANFKRSIPEHKHLFYDAHLDSLEEPYTIESTGASVKLSTALGILHRYCLQLPSDIYTPLSPKYRITQVKWGYICELELPSNSPVQIKIIGRGHISMQLAYMSTALETCKILHNHGELDDNLVPLSNKKFAERECFDFEADSGTTKKHRLYDKRVADIFIDNFISAGKPFWIYVIEMEIVQKVSDEFNPKKRKVMDITPHVFGLCSTRSIPEIPTFPIFHKYAKYIASVKVVPEQFIVSRSELQKIQRFHAYAFENILGLSDQLAFEPTGAMFSSLIVPMKKSQNSYEINYGIAEKTVNGFPSAPTEDQRKNFVYNCANYQDAIVKPWYNGSENRIYYVEEVSAKTLNSLFNDNGFLTFKDRYKKHYNLDAHNAEQHLLDASTVSKELNYLFPPYITKKSRNNKQKVYLIPEFVLLHPLPASYWLMLLRIPSALYRINHLLLADQLRHKIIKDISDVSLHTPSKLDGLDYFYEDNEETIEKFDELRHSELLDEASEENEVDENDTSDYSDEGFLSDIEYSDPKWNDSYILDDMEDNLNVDSSLKLVECDDLPKNNEMNALKAELPLILSSDYYNDKKIEERLTAPELPVDFKIWSNHTHESSFGVQPALLLQALTTTGACDGFNLERLETMGDSFLKLIVTIYLYQHYPTQNEGRLTFLRSMQICNANLLKLGCKIGIPSLMVSHLFEPKHNWIPPCYSTQDDFDDDCNEDNNVLPKEIDVKTEFNRYLKQRMSDKSVADCVEALIGAHLIYLGAETTIKFMKWLGLKVDYSTSSIKAPIQCLAARFESHEAQQHVLLKYTQWSFEKLEENIGYSFRDKSFLVQAFIHLSSGLPLGCYQRLEFLGDAVLDFLITQHLYNHNLKFSPGVLTDLRSALVNNINFASLVIKHGLHHHLIVENEKLSNSIKKFEYLCEQKGDLNFHDMMELATENDAGEVLIEQVEVPKALGDIFESLAGAVFLDSEMNIEVVWRVFHNLMEDVIAKWCQNPPRSPVRELMEDYKSRIGTFEKGPKVNDKACILIKVDGKTVISGVGKSERLAKRSAALEALKYFKQSKATKV